MTAQTPERLLYQGETLTLCSEPLGHFMEMLAMPWKFYAFNTSLWRGYVGTWRIEGERLYLTKLQGWVKESEQVKEVGLEALFPGYPDGVFAHWFTGELRCPRGGLLKYVHGGYGSTYEEDLLLQLQRGVLQEERVVRNGIAKPDAVQGYIVGAKYVGG